MIPQIKEYIETNWNNFFDIQPESLQLLLLSNPQGKKITHGKCTVLIFKNHEKHPVLVSKFLRSKNAMEEKVTKEHQYLKRLKSWVRSPIAYDLTVINDRNVAIEQYRYGTSLKSDLQKRVNKLSVKDVNEVIDNITDDFNKTSALLSELVELKLDASDEQNTYGDNAINNKESLFNLLELSTSQIDVLNKLIENYTNSLQSAHLVHLDLTPSNVLKNEGVLSLIDFEFTQSSRHSFLDPMRFMFYYFHLLYELNILNGNSYEASFYYWFKENNKSKQIIEEFICSTLGEFDEESFFSRISLFLLCNLQLQLEETDFIDDAFIIQTRNLITISLNILEGEVPDLEIYNNEVELPLEELQDEFKKQQQELEDLRAAMVVRDMQIEQNTDYIKHCHNVIEEKDKALNENVQYIDQCHSAISQKDKELNENIQYINQCHDTISQKDKELDKNISYISKCHDTINDKDIQVLQLENELVNSKDLLLEQQNQIEVLHNQIRRNPLKEVIRKIRKR